MYTYEVFTKEERIEILKSFQTTNTFWQQQVEPSHYVSFDANISMDIDPHLPLRCEERFVSPDSFFLAMEAFFGNDGIDPRSGEELPSVFDLVPGDWVVLADSLNKISFVFQYTGIDQSTKMDEVLCKTVIPFRSFESTYFKEGNKVFELATKDNGEFFAKYVDDSKLTFK
ncbi:hypothetical protein AAGG74_17505 [Bacillus mexicanus]|uniref:hypothetical protein n=1 Tax=Bacillus mexicanus TaxID=2834415 RepID=UPI003D21AD52